MSKIRFCIIYHFIYIYFIIDTYIRNNFGIINTDIDTIIVIISILISDIL